MTSAFVSFDAVLGVLRVAFLGAAAALLVVCTIDWLVRTKRLNPFGSTARFFRQTVDPLFAPVERQVVRAGGLPSNAPWWGLAAVVLAGIIVLELLGFVRDQAADIMFAAQSGPRSVLKLLVSWVFRILQLAIVVRVICSWIRVSPYSPWVRWAFVLSEPILRPLRRIVPNLGMIDITPIVAYFLIGLVASMLGRLW